MKKLFAIALTLALLLTILALPTTVHAEIKGPGLYYVNTEYSTLRLRNGPGLDYDLVHKLNKGEVVYVAGFEGNWARVATLDDNAYFGYASADYLKFYEDYSKPAKKTTEKPKATKTYKNANYIETLPFVVMDNASSWLNVRDDASLDAAKIGKLYPGDVVNVVALEDEWAKITYGRHYAYVHCNYICLLQRVFDESTLTGFYKVMVNPGSTLNIRKGPGMEYERVCKVDYGTFIEVVEYHNDWSVVNVNGKLCYVKTEYIIPVR